MDEPQATQPTNDDFQLLYEFVTARRGDSELFQRVHRLCDRVRNIANLEQAGADAKGRLEITQGKLREAAAELAEVHGQVHQTRLRVMLVQTIDEAHARAADIIRDAEQKAAALLEAAGREVRQREAHLKRASRRSRPHTTHCTKGFKKRTRW